MSTGFHPSFAPLCVHSISFLLIGALRHNTLERTCRGTLKGEP